jgi:PIN domain nuclease of toxin-antitoxin system
VKRVCVDTHALVWHLSKPGRLGKSAARLLLDADRGRVSVLVPAIVGIELASLRGAGRKTLGVPQLEALMAAQPAFSVLPLDLAQVREFALLETVPDPFDRMIVAAARVAGAPLVTADMGIRESALVEVAWDWSKVVPLAADFLGLTAHEAPSGSR